MNESIDLPVVDATELERVEGGAIGVRPVTPSGDSISVRLMPFPHLRRGLHPLPPQPVLLPCYG